MMLRKSFMRTRFDNDQDGQDDALSFEQNDPENGDAERRDAALTLVLPGFAPRLDRGISHRGVSGIPP